MHDPEVDLHRQALTRTFPWPQRVMPPTFRSSLLVPALFVTAAIAITVHRNGGHASASRGDFTVRAAVAHDVSAPLATLLARPPVETRRGTLDAPSGRGLLAAPDDDQAQQGAPVVIPQITAPAGSAAVEQTVEGTKPAAALVESFDGLGVGFTGPQGAFTGRNPSDNSFAVGPDHVLQTVNSRMAIFTRKGRLFDTTGRALYGPVPTNNMFRGLGGACETSNNGDAVVRFDHLAGRWLLVMPIFRRGAARPDQPAPWPKGPPAHVSPRGAADAPGRGTELYQPPPPPPDTTNPAAAAARGGAGRAGAGRGAAADGPQGPYGMCYAASVGADPLGRWYRYEFLRPYFPDYPRPAIWPDGYYVPSSTGDNRISDSVITEKHACVAERAKMLRGEPATEQCVIVHDVNFLNNADLDGSELPPSGAPNIIIAGGGTQLIKILEADSVSVWRLHVDWKDPSKTTLAGPDKIAVAPYHYLCDGQLTNCVPQPGTDRRLDAQGDKIMPRVVYRRIGNRESVVAVHSVNTTAGGGGVRWYEFLVAKDRSLTLHQQGTYAPGGFFRWMASPATDRFGNIGIGYSFGGAPNFAGQRFAGRAANDPLGKLTTRETILAEGQASQTTTLRWEDYTQAEVDPRDDCTIWYVGDYFKREATAYSTRIGAFRMAGCGAERPR